MPTTHFRTCPLCEATCGLALTVENGAVTRIAGDADDVFSQGFLCPKGATLHHLHEDPDRLRAPLIRHGDDPARSRWEKVSWDEAFAEVERRLMPIIAQHGRDAIAAYLGNPNAHNLTAPLYGRPLLKALGTRNVYSASTVDQMPKHVSSGLLFGNANAIPVPDLDRCDFLLMLGANPWESNGSLCTAPDFPGRMRAIQKRGGRVVVVDPRRTRSAEHADEHVYIRPGTDALLLMAMIQVVLGDPISRGRLAPWIDGIERLRVLAEPFRPAAVERATGVAAETIFRLAHELAETDRAAVYGRLGTHTVPFGTLAAWGVDVLNVLTGHLDAPGGVMWPLPAHARPGKPGPGKGFSMGRYKSRVKGYPEVRGELPVATLADEIETPGPGQVRALVTVAGNPARSAPNSARLSRALSGLDCMISVDIYRNETTRYAHVILPPPSPLEKSHYDLSLYALAVRNVAKWSAPVFSYSGPSEADILARLTLIAEGAGANADVAAFHRRLEEETLTRLARECPALAGRPLASLLEALRAPTPGDRLLEMMLRTGAYGDRFGEVPDGLTFEKLAAHPHGIDFGPLSSRLPEILQTRTGRIELTPQPIVDDLARLTRALSDEIPDEQLLLVGRRDLRSNNSWMHNIPALIKGRERCTLHVHPRDAARIGLVEGAAARVATETGELIARVEITDGIMPGVVSLPHGFGHDAPGAQLRVAAARPGVNANLLIDSDRIDPLSGNAVLNGIPVEVAPA